jgi:tetratricopeptide (TPR) repeat protein
MQAHAAAQNRHNESEAYYLLPGAEKKAKKAGIRRDQAIRVSTLLASCATQLYFIRDIIFSMATVGEMFALAWKHCQAGEFSAAEQLYLQMLQAASAHVDSVRLLPVCAQAHFNLGVVLARQGKLDEAIAHYRRSLRFNPESVETHNNLANALRQKGLVDEALASYRQALRSRPNCAETYNNLGTALAELGRLDDAVACFQGALRINSSLAEVHNNLGEAVKRLDRLDEALVCFQRALQINPHFAAAHNNVGDALQRLGRVDEALPFFDRAIQLNPEFGLAHWNRALAWLLLGDFHRGWPEYEWRWTQPRFVPRGFPQPLWDGSALDGKAILLHAEQGLGDSLQFIRYVPLVKERGGRVIVECQAELCRLFARLAGADQVLAHGSTLPAFDLHAPLGSLPGIFWAALAGIPSAVPYLRADPALAEHWRRELRQSPNSEVKKSISGIGHRASDLLVGIAWQGNPAYGYDRQRSVPVTAFAPLADVEGIQFISLQKGPGADQLSGLAERFSVHDLGSRLDEAAGPFMDTAAIVENLDLVISSDTAVPHLAGALGVPVWVALSAVPDWRWLLEREDSSWYPTMRLFRQTRSGCWDDVFTRMAEEVKSLVAATKRSVTP